MEKVVSATEARIRFGELLRKVVEGGETVIVSRAGKLCAAILPFPEYQRLIGGREKEAEEALKKVLAVGQAIRQTRGGRPLPPPEEILAALRKERDAELTGLR